jgi:hypothetical protein
VRNLALSAVAQDAGPIVKIALDGHFYRLSPAIVSYSNYTHAIIKHTSQTFPFNPTASFMITASYLFDTYAVAERTLGPAALSEAVCTAVRLGKHALEHERQAAFLLPLSQQNRQLATTCAPDEDLAGLLEACVQRDGESKDAFVNRLAGTANLSAIRVTLAQLFQQEYGENAAVAQAASERRSAIRKLCSATPPEVWSDIVQGNLKVEDADFLAVPNFTVFPVHTN